MSEDIIRYVNAASQGDTDAIAKLYAKTLKSSYYLALKLSNDADEAAEITKNAYARVFCTVSRLKKPEAFEIYMRQNIAAVYKESQKFTFGDAVADVSESSLEFLTEDVYQDEKKAAAAVAAVASLSPEMRTAIVLHYFSGMPSGPLSRYFNVSESTANSVLAAAKQIIFEKSGSGNPFTMAADAYPVLNRIFKREAENVTIEPSVVRSMFAYIIEKYNVYKQAEVKKAPADQAKSYFKSSPSIPAGGNKASSVEVWGEGEEEELDYSAFTDEQPNYPAKTNNANPVLAGVGGFFGALSKKIKNIGFVKTLLKKYNPQFLLACGIGILALLLIIIIIICSVAGKKQKSAEIDSKWVAGGFEEFSDITYLNENMCSFKYNNKYGLMDYAGNILVQPNYDSQFVNCGYGRDYSTSDGGSGKYHVYVMVNGNKMGVSYSAGHVEIGQIHSDHGSDNSTIDDKDFKYEERDRYFEGYAAAMNKKGNWGYVDSEGKEVIPFKYEAVNITDDSSSLKYSMDYCRPVTGGYIAVKKDGKMGIINMDNEVVADFEYEVIMPGKDGVFIAKKNGKWGVILVGDAVKNYKAANHEISTAPESFTDENGVPIDSDSPIAGKHFKAADGGINIRSTPNSSSTSNIIGTAKPGEILTGVETVTGSNGSEWLKITYDGGYAYVSMKVVTQMD